MSSPPTLYEWAGGKEAFERLINAFYDRVEGDELLSPFFPGGVTEEDELGGYERMVGRHGGLGITPEHRFRFASLMSLAADDAGLPEDPEFRSAFVAYVEWGTRLALHNSQPGAEVPPHAPVPRWGWGEAPPYEP
jgi:hemoglobin